MADIISLKPRHPLVGTWRSDEDDARSEYIILLHGGNASVRGRDFLDGEEYEISNVVVEDHKIEFDTLMHSTGRRGHLTLTRDGNEKYAEMKFSFTDIGRAVKISD